MLYKKMLRELKANFGQFFSLFLLAFLAVSLFACMKSSNIGGYKAMYKMWDETNRGDGWLYGEDFDSDDASALLELDEIKDAQLRTHIGAKTEEYNSAQLEVFLERENTVSKPLVVSGTDFDPADKEGIWISKSFADCWELGVGDEFAYLYEGVRVAKTIRGLIYSPEYIYLKADKDADIFLDDICIAYMSCDAFPVKDLVLHLIENGKISASDIMGNEGESALDEEKLRAMLPFTELVITTDVENVTGLEKKIADALNRNYAVFLDENSMTGIKPFLDELEQHDQFSYVFAFVFLLVALLVIMTTMGRIVEQQRTQIGTLNAMGMKRGRIAMHYLGYSFIVSLLGSVIGFFVGTYVFGEGLADIFKKWYLLPDWKQDYDLQTVMVIFVTVAVCVLSTWFATRKLMKVAPSTALRPAAPKSGKSCIFEKLPFWNKLGFYSQYNLRDASRAKLRTFMGIFGCACGMCFMVCAFACRITIDKVFELSFEKLQNYSTEIDFNDDISLKRAEELAAKYEGELVMNSAIEVAAKSDAVAEDKKSAVLTVTEGKEFYRLVNTGYDVVSLKEGEVAITMKMAKSLGVKEGDVIYWHIYTKNDWHSARIGLINRIPTGSAITMLRSDLEKTGVGFEPSMLCTDKPVEQEDEKSSEVLAVHTREELRNALEVSMEMIDAMILVFVIFAAILPIVVLFNCGNLSFNERVKEFATLKVLGFKTSQIRTLLARQNLVLSLIGIVIGAPFGKIMLQYMFDSNGDSFDYQVFVGAFDYILSGILILIISVSVSFMFNKRIKNLDMVESLKGME